MNLPDNATCDFCGERFRQRPHILARHKREGKGTYCCNWCSQQPGRIARGNPFVLSRYNNRYHAKRLGWLQEE